jgi:hypothetical protein
MTFYTKNESATVFVYNVYKSRLLDSGGRRSIAWGQIHSPSLQSVLIRKFFSLPYNYANDTRPGHYEKANYSQIPYRSGFMDKIKCKTLVNLFTSASILLHVICITLHGLNDFLGTFPIRNSHPLVVHMHSILCKHIYPQK